MELSRFMEVASSPAKSTVIPIEWLSFSSEDMEPVFTKTLLIRQLGFIRRGKEINHSRRIVQTVFTSHHRRRDKAGLFVPAECPAEDQTWSLEEAVGLLATEQPALGQVRASNELRKRGIFISPCGVRCVWQRHDMETFPKPQNVWLLWKPRLLSVKYEIRQLTQRAEDWNLAYDLAANN
jgi:hypothetical protein